MGQISLHRLGDEDLVALGNERHVESHHGGHEVAVRPGAVDHDRRGDVAPCGAHPGHPVSVAGDADGFGEAVDLDPRAHGPLRHTPG